MLTKKLRKQAEGLVNRADLGDQNALAMIQAIGKNARGGNKRAQESLSVIMAFMKSNRRQHAPVFGAETTQALGTLKDPTISPEALLQTLCSIPQTQEPDALDAACVILSQACPWTPDRIQMVQSRVIPHMTPSFMAGLFTTENEVPKDADIGHLCAGHVIGTAYRLQLVQNGAPLAILGEAIQWELG